MNGNPIYTGTKPKWKWCLGGDWRGLTVLSQSVPSAFHRFMQRWLLGIHWEKL